MFGILHEILHKLQSQDLILNSVLTSCAVISMYTNPFHEQKDTLMVLFAVLGKSTKWKMDYTSYTQDLWPTEKLNLAIMPPNLQVIRLN